VSLLSKRVLHLRLAEGDELDVLFPPGFAHIVIEADTLTIEGLVRLPGRALDIRARVIEAHAVDERPATLDVSGGPAKPDFHAGTSAANGTATKPDGLAGQDGGAGCEGGSVVIAAERVIGALHLRADGSRGGNSQSGGNGAQPRQVNGVDGAFVKAKWPAKGRYGGKVLQGQGLQNYVAYAAGQPGGDAKAGGAAGASGRPGDGGSGGKVHLRLGSDATVTTSAAGGAAGRPGASAIPGAAGKAGSGGRNLIYSYNITKTRKAYARAGVDAVIDDYAKKFGIAAHAADGRGGAKDGPVPPLPTARPAADGEVLVETVSPEALGAVLDVDFLRLVLAGASTALAAGDEALALQRYRWLATITAQRSASDEQVARIHEAAEAGATRA
jgi:hypothetical protein